MDVRLTSEQRQLRDAAAKLADDLGPGVGAGPGRRQPDRAAGEGGRRDGLAFAALRRRVGRRGGASSPRNSDADSSTCRSSARCSPTNCAGMSAATPEPATLGSRRRAVDARGFARALTLAAPRFPRPASARHVPTADLTRTMAELSGSASRRRTRRRRRERFRALAIVATTADILGAARGAHALACRVRENPRAVRQADRVVSGRGAHAGRGPGADRGVDQRAAPCRVGRRRTRRRPRRSAPPRSRRSTARAPPEPCARPPSRCTAASATPGSAWRTSICGARWRRRELFPVRLKEIDLGLS